MRVIYQSCALVIVHELRLEIASIPAQKCTKGFDASLAEKGGEKDP